MQTITSRIVYLAFISLILCSCHSVKPPQRPVAYLYPTVMAMSELEDCKARATTPQLARELLEKASVLSLLNAEGMLPGDLEIMARGLTKRGYAELDARRTDGNLQWVAILALDHGFLILCGFRKLPPPAARFDAVISDDQSHTYYEHDTYGRIRTITKYPSAHSNVILRRVRVNGKTHWETRVFIDSP